MSPRPDIGAPKCFARETFGRWPPFRGVRRAKAILTPNRQPAPAVSRQKGACHGQA